MKKIEIYEHCFGPGVIIDGVNLHIDSNSYDGSVEEEQQKIVDKKIDQLIDKLKEIKCSLDQCDLYAIAEMVATRGGYEYDEENSQEGESCNQCGNYNYSYVYVKNG